MFEHEIAAADNPYYNDEPAEITALDWIIVLLALALRRIAASADPIGSFRRDRTLAGSKASDRVWS